MLYQIVYDTFHGENAERPASDIDHRQMPIPSFLHASNRGTNRFARLDHNRFSRHAPFQAQAERFSRSQDPAHQVTFCKDTHQLAILADEDTPDPMLPHQRHRVGHRLIRQQAQRRGWLQPGDTLHLEISGQLHVSVFNPHAQA
jgi:hypothetical protein